MCKLCLTTVSLYDVALAADLSYPNVSLCTTGFKENYSCGTYAQGSCPSGYVAVANTNKFLEVYNNTCQSGYNKQTLPSAIIGYQSPLSRMFYPDVNVCGNGVTSNYSCSTYAQGSCPENYYDTKLPDSAFAFQTNSACPSGYTSYPYAEKLNDQYGLFGNGTIVDVSWLNWGGDRTGIQHMCLWRFCICTKCHANAG